MKKKMNILFTSAFFFLILISYQNCGTTQQGSLFDAQTFGYVPYEFTINQIAYMSCAEQGGVANDQGVYFTFRSGAYPDANGNTVAGLRLTEDFLYETRRGNDSQRMDILFEDPGTALSRLQFATRRSNSLNSMFVNQDSGGGVEEFDFDFVFGDFGSDEMSAALLTQPALGNEYERQYLDYWSPAGVNRDAYFEGTLVYNSSESLAQQVRSFFAQDGVLTWAYAEPTKPASLRSPAYYDTPEEDETGEEEPVVSNKALGKGFKIAFKQPLPRMAGYGSKSPHVNVPKRVLQSVSEFDLSNPASVTSSNWSCPNELQLRILRPIDIWKAGNPQVPVDANFADNPGTVDSAHDKLCPQREDDHSDNAGGGRAALLDIIRRSLPVSDWYVNVKYRCIIPKRHTLGSCYGIDNGSGETRQPEYNFTVACNPAIVSAGVFACSHFMSICHRN